MSTSSACTRRRSSTPRTCAPRSAAGKAVLCDKPFALDADEAAALVEEAAAAGAIALCNFEFRFHPVRRLLRELVRTDALGAIEHVQWTHLSAGSRVPLRRYGWLFDRARGGGWIGAWGSHAIDTIRWCFGEVAERRRAVRASTSPSVPTITASCTRAPPRTGSARRSCSTRA